MGAAYRRAPPRECERCPRLVAYRTANRVAEPTWHNAPVDSFGPADARLLVVGLAPGRGGANRTGRPFTGDYAGDVLYAALRDHGFATGTYRAEPDDGLVLHDCRVTNAVRCVPPENKPTASEIQACRPFLEDELQAGTPPELVLCLGRVAFDASLRALGATPSRHRFAHGAATAVADGPRLIASYHTSRYNLNTGRLTRAMFDTVLAEVRRLLPRS